MTGFYIVLGVVFVAYSLLILLEAGNKMTPEEYDRWLDERRKER